MTDSENRHMVKHQPLTVQQEQYVTLRTRGMTPEAAASAVGLPSDIDSIYQMHEDNPQIDMRLIQAREQVRRASIMSGVKFNMTKDDAALMYMEAHTKAENATEEIKAVDSLVKLYGLAEPEKRDVRISSREQMQELDDESLMEQMGEEILLNPSEYVSNDNTD